MDNSLLFKNSLFFETYFEEMSTPDHVEIVDDDDDDSEVSDSDSDSKTAAKGKRRKKSDKKKKKKHSFKGSGLNGSV